ncbi:MAG: transpeptidase family protein [Myxococcales bacterium]|jgi:cell division protein FtsI (penicillin-binding protein 3)|nr:transpeptidase family protein [Myxococcales bacterium]
MIRERQTAELQTSAVRGIRVRLSLIGLGFALGFGVLAWRAIQLQVVQNPALSTKAQGQYDRRIQILGQRGRILDRLNREFAASVDVDSVFIDPSLLKSQAQLQEEEATLRKRAEARGKVYKPSASTEIREREEAIRRLAKALGTSTSQMGKLLDTSRKFVWLKRRATHQEVAAIKAANVAGVGFQKEARRFYPQRELASHLLGYANVDGHGIEGLERVFDDVLRGKRDDVSGLRDARGRPALMDGTIPSDTLTGASVTLTIDSVIQHLTEKALQAAVDKAQAKAGMAVVLDPRTGEILALANVPTFNPNTPARFDVSARRNRAVVDQMEQGSTLKPITVAAALEEGLIQPDSVFDGEQGRMRIGKHTINDSHPNGSMTVAEIIQASSNIGVTKIAQRLGRERLQAYHRAFGFGEKPGTELPGEARGALPYPRSEIALATQSFGQGMSTSVLQIAVAYGALANGGNLMKPYLVSRIVDAEGRLLLAREPEVARKVVSDKTARQVLDMMQLVVERGGTGRAARMDDYPVAAKSGTAQKVDPNGGYSKTKRLASFAGMVPSDAPRLVIAVAIDEPTTNVYGGVVAAPAFKEIAQGALVHLGVPPRVVAQSSAVVADAAERSRHERTAQASRSRLAGAFAMAAQIPEPSDDDSVGEGFVEEEGAPSPSDETLAERTRVPDLYGLSARAAVAALLSADLDPMLSGWGKAVGQTPLAGTSVRKGAQVTVRFE